MALRERIDQGLIERPILVDLRESTHPEAEPEAEAESDAAPRPRPEARGGTDARVRGGQGDDWGYGEGHRPSRAAALSEEADRKHDAMQNMASRPESLHDDLAHQLSFLESDPTARSLAEYIIFNLDDNGFLKPTLYDIVRDYLGDATVADAERAPLPGPAARPARDRGLPEPQGMPPPATDPRHAPPGCLAGAHRPPPRRHRPEPPEGRSRRRLATRSTSSRRRSTP